MKNVSVDFPLSALGATFVLRAELGGESGDADGRILAAYIHDLLFAFEREGATSGSHSD